MLLASLRIVALSAILSGSALAADREQPALLLEQVDLSDFDLPVTTNDEVSAWMSHFLGPGRKTLVAWLQRGGAYAPVLTAELHEAGLPTDLLYLSMIESGFQPQAVSPSGAAGLWQFMPATATQYGLSVDGARDQREDPVLATRAAAAFLGDLHARYGDWYLAMAAYNGGPGYVDEAMRSSGAEDFWALTQAGQLRAETATYVPKILAVAILCRYPDRYGLPAMGAAAESGVGLR